MKSREHPIAKPSIFSLLKLPDFVSLASVVCGFLAIVQSVRQDFMGAALLIIAAAFFDWLNGEVAGLIQRKGNYGIELDSLTDAINFGVAPAIFGYFLGLKDNLSLVVFIIFISASILRLARFNIIKKEAHYVLGLPTTANGIAIPMLYSLLGIISVPFEICRWIYLAYFLAASVAMLSRVSVPSIKMFRTYEYTDFFEH